MKKALVLSSGGVDSTTCVGIAVKDVGSENVSTVSVFYGQKHNKELECADKVAEFKRQLRLNDNILRTMFMEVSEKASV